MLSHNKGFTLVEVIIVILIIGILAATLIPKIIGAQAQARDTTRYGDVSQLINATILYSADNKTVLAGNGNADIILSGMVGTYIKSIPVDPVTNNSGAQFCVSAISSGGKYLYLAGNTNFVVVANTEVIKKGNRDHAATGCVNVNSASRVESIKTIGSGDMYIYYY